jgi:phage terminase large subunit-like protein
MTHANVTGGGTLNPAIRKKGARIDPAVLDAAIAEYAAGGSMTDIALRYGVSRNHLYECAARRGVRKLVRVPHGAMARDVLPEPAQVAAIGPHRVRLVHGPDVWAAVRRDYEGGYPAGACAERYGVAVATLRDRAKREGWRRKRAERPAPLVAPPDPAQVAADADGALRSAWATIAHAAQRAPEGDWSTWLFLGGRGAGKTRAGAEWLAALAEATPRGRFALIGATHHDVRTVMIDGPSGLMHLPGRARPRYEPSRRRLVWDNDAEAYAFSAEEPERLRGPQFMAAWADEFATWKDGAYTLMNARMGLRLGVRPRLVVTTTPKPDRALRRLRDEASCVVTQAPTAANAAHLPPDFVDRLRALYGGTRWETQELEGVLAEDEGALWRAADFVRARGEAPARFDRVVVAVDPPAGDAGAACGIVVAGRAGARAYVLADMTAEGLSPLGWAGRAVDAAGRYGAAEIVAEANQGGDMVRTTLALAGARVPLRLVHATLSKRARAQPVAALYEQGRVTHVGAFPALEEEMLALGGDGRERRRDRADALVWALTVLLVEAQRPEPRILRL